MHGLGEAGEEPTDLLRTGLPQYVDQHPDFPFVMIAPLQQSQDLVETLRACGGQVEFTIYPQAGHDSWTETYSNPELYAWLLRQALA